MKKALLLITLVSFTLAQITNPFTGVAIDTVSINDVLTGGWSQCWSDAYGDSGENVQDIIDACTGEYIMYACKPTNDQIFHLAAYALRDDVFYFTEGDTETTFSNEVQWYFSDEAMGFADEEAIIDRRGCDTDSGDSRLCWHVLDGATNSGFRCGDNSGLNDETFSKYIFHSNNPFSPIDTCVNDASCSNGHGICVSTYGGGSACSCLPGFGGDSLCTNRPATCSYSSVYPNVTNFNPAASFSIARDFLSLAVSANLEESQFATPETDDTLNSATSYALETRVRFGSGAATKCDYPPGTSSKRWVHDPAGDSCIDNWGLTVPWSSAVSDCGFSDANNDHTWTQMLTISRKYQLPDLAAGTPAVRTESITKELRVVFPTTVVVQTDVNVTGPVSVTVSAVVSSGYEPSLSRWVIVLKTVTNKPYKLSSPSIASSTGGLNTRYGNYLVVSDVSACNTNEADCVQYITLRFTGCTAISGALSLTAVPVCSGSSGATCASIPNGLVSFAMTVNNADSCPVVNNIAFSVSSLYAYSDSSFASPQNQFRASDIAYFGAVIKSTNATLISFSISGVCIQFDAQACDNTITYTTLSPTSAFNPTFSINMAQTRKFTQDTGIQGFVIKATVSVTWAEDTKRDAVTQTAIVNLNSAFGVYDAKEEEEEEAMSGAGVKSIGSAVLLLIMIAML